MELSDLPPREGQSPGSGNGAGTAASFHNPSGVAVDSSGILYVADTANHIIRKIEEYK